MDTFIRLSFALGIFVELIIWELLSPRRQQLPNRSQRWQVNLGLAVFNTLIMRVTIGSWAYLSAVNAAEQSIGLLNNVAVPAGLAIAVSVLLLDFAIYCQHIASHRWAWLWRLHQVHHSDIAFDVTTAVRFHPLEIGISMLYKTLCVYSIGAPPIAVLVFEILLNGAALFNHSNINLPANFDTFLRTIMVTPDMHRIHHSTDYSEHNSNYGFCLSCWDELCGTYTAEPKHSHTTMDIGLNPYHQSLNFFALLCLPFKTLRR